MLITAKDLEQLVASVWSTVLGFEAESLGRGATAETAGFWTGCVRITGAWRGAVVLACPVALAEQAASQVFGVNLPEVDPELVRDLLGELTNILAGNLKALLPEVSCLGLPIITTGGEPDLSGLESRPLLRVAFRSRSQLFVLFVFASEVDPCNQRAARMLCAG